MHFLTPLDVYPSGVFDVRSALDVYRYAILDVFAKANIVEKMNKR